MWSIHVHSQVTSFVHLFVVGLMFNENVQGDVVRDGNVYLFSCDVGRALLRRFGS